ncbi:MAG: hypothetical protein ACRDHZ_04155 [Ktedonobacteraceae bacterium]
MSNYDDAVRDLYQKNEEAHNAFRERILNEINSIGGMFAGEGSTITVHRQRIERALQHLRETIDLLPHSTKGQSHEPIGWSGVLPAIARLDKKRRNAHE